MHKSSNDRIWFFGCRKCAGITYQSTMGHRWDRSARRVEKLRARLDWRAHALDRCLATSEVAGTQRTQIRVCVTVCSTRDGLRVAFWANWQMTYPLVGRQLTSCPRFLGRRPLRNTAVPGQNGRALTRIYSSSAPQYALRRLVRTARWPNRTQGRRDCFGEPAIALRCQMRLVGKYVVRDVHE